MNITWPAADTTPDAAWAQVLVYRRMPPEKRLALALHMSDSLRSVAADGVRHRHPEFTEEEVRLSVIRLCLGGTLFHKAYPEVQLPR